MSMDPFTGATRDPIALLEQLIGQVGGLKRYMDEVKQELKQDICEVKQELGQVKQDICEVKQELGQVKQDFGSRFDRLETEVGLVHSDIAGVRSEMVRFIAAVDKEQEAFKSQVEVVLDRKSWLARNEWQTEHADLERRVAELEATERRRKEGKGA